MHAVAVVVGVSFGYFVHVDQPQPQFRGDAALQRRNFTGDDRIVDGPAGGFHGGGGGNQHRRLLRLRAVIVDQRTQIALIVVGTAFPVGILRIVGAEHDDDDIGAVIQAVLVITGGGTIAMRAGAVHAVILCSGAAVAEVFHLVLAAQQRLQLGGIGLAVLTADTGSDAVADASNFDFCLGAGGAAEHRQHSGATQRQRQGGGY